MNFEPGVWFPRKHGFPHHRTSTNVKSQLKYIKHLFVFLVDPKVLSTVASRFKRASIEALSPWMYVWKIWILNSKENLDIKFKAKDLYTKAWGSEVSL